MSRPVGWYVRRLRRMSGTEVAGRVADRGRQQAWRRRWVHPGETAPLPRQVRGSRTFASPLPVTVRAAVPDPVRDRIVAAADRILAGEWNVLGVPRPDSAAPDWFLDPASGRRAPAAAYCFTVDHRDEALTGNVKNVWELSRHHHLTVLAAAWWLTEDDRYAENAAAQLRSWWAANPFLSGIHWTSGIEVGVRLISWVWVRRLLDGWAGVTDLFGDDAVRQIWWHQRYLASFRSRGSSANNHVIAEQAGLLAAACAFPWYAESPAWRASASATLERELARNTFPSGLNRELATDYHRFVAELGLVAAAEADAAGHPLGEATWSLLVRSLDAAAAILDCTGRPPRQGDGDEGRALVIDETDPWAELLSAGAAVVGPMPWWPASGAAVFGPVLHALAPTRRTTAGRPPVRPDDFPDAGLTLLRTPAGESPEIWCRVDGGPHGFLSIAAHGHADALSVEVRHDGVEVLVDPGTYCYHGEPEWRRYFRSTLGHNSIKIDGADQSVSGGPFMWERHAGTAVDLVHLAPSGRRSAWLGHHDGYTRLGVKHQRRVVLDDGALTLTDTLTDTLTHTRRGVPGADRAVEGAHTARLALHLGPQVSVELDGSTARLTWPTRSQGCAGDPASGPETVEATLELPPELDWSLHRGETSPPLGWYSPRFGMRVPSPTLVGIASFTVGLELTTVLRLPPLPASASAVALAFTPHGLDARSDSTRGVTTTWGNRPST